MTEHALTDPIDLGYGEVTHGSAKDVCVRLVDYGDEFWIPKHAFHATSEVPGQKTGKVVVTYAWAKQEGWTDEGNA